MELKELKAKYEELGREIKRLESPDTTYVQFQYIPNGLHVHVADKEMTWQEAVDYAESIGMRLPTKLELQMIAASTDEFNQLGWTWSASTLSNGPTVAWYVDLDNGYTYTIGKTISNSVLCVSP